MSDFDDARLDAPETTADERLRQLASTGARIRQESLGVSASSFGERLRPRGIIALGAECRLIRAVVEPVCPAPVVAWAAEGLPGWVGPLDLVVILGSAGASEAPLASAREAVRRGASLLVAAPKGSLLAEFSAGRSTVALPTKTSDSFAAAVAVLDALHQLGLGPLVVPDHVAEAADLVALACSPGVDVSGNPAKQLALGMADDLPLFWGGTVLAARASRRIAEAVRTNCARPALALDADDLYPLLAGLKRRDPFADPFEDPLNERFEMLVTLEDRFSPSVVHHTHVDIVSAAEQLGMRVHNISAGEDERPGTELDRYVTLLLHGLYAATYLGIALAN